MYMNDSFSWSGSYLNSKGENVLASDSQLVLDSPLVTFVNRLAHHGRFTIVRVPPPPLQAFPEAIHKLQKYTGHHHDYDGCAMMASLHLVDLCVGTFRQSENKAQLARFLPTITVEPLYLIVHRKYASVSFVEALSAAFEPLAPSLWLALFGVILVYGIAMSLIDPAATNTDGDSDDVPTARKAVVFGTYLAVFGFVSGGPPYAPGAWSGRVLNLGFALLCLLASATYTANLASMLTLSPADESISSIAELAADEGATFCVATSASTWSKRYEQLRDDRFIHVHHEVDAINGVASGKCTAAGATRQGLELAHAKGNLCQVEAVDIIGAERISMPVSEQYAQPLSVLVEHLLEDNVLQQYVDRAKPVSTCVPPSPPSAAITVTDFSGPIFTCVAVLLVALLVHALECSMRSHSRLAIVRCCRTGRKVEAQQWTRQAEVQPAVAPPPACSPEVGLPPDSALECEI